MEPKQYSLEKCTKTKCPRCDIGYILKNYVKPLIQLLTNDIKDYYMGLLTTKCLNTSVMLSFFMLGRKRGLEIADYCDTRKVIKRHEAKEQNNADMIKSLKKDILHKNIKYRYLYYILMTDAYFPFKDASKQSGFFPGHVFLMEKIPGEKEPTYYFYQSYINEYDFKGHVEKHNNTLFMSHSQVATLMDKIEYALMNETWDQNTVKYWKDFTYVDTPQLKGSQSGGKFYLCWRKARLYHCVENIERYTRMKLKDISKFKLHEMNNIYGNASSYEPQEKPLTVYEVKSSLEKLHTQIISGYLKNNI